ncbi:hypothetical protein SPRG_08960 [Saprolegnia parasitica CBS 223.65]|uniref:HECT-type E3 ubiquitin transferase n=1 Tax=Saprolegnia parasitica (strain CBS 223.65) TaxID=695850 RepID=A0A067CGK2_SAPPC|nr:hypothetical protein SPRG_08960 [Saprolegnia parasitica CBS 223.65]KDO25661.1 hypothetical protein SPRG_08960 [Saprolegnia parasitica CBS 223.65]|eukprot:XP_012203691.1 hypothetical protein SPRG_08960 [Saprolegnia parasitica CBS 223.65]
MFDGKSTRAPRVSMSGRRDHVAASKKDVIAAAQRERMERAQKRTFHINSTKVQAWYRSVRSRRAVTQSLLASVMAKCNDIAALQRLYSFVVPLPVLTRLVQEAVFVQRFLPSTTTTALLELLLQAWTSLDDACRADAAVALAWHRRLAVLCATAFRVDATSPALLAVLPRLSLPTISHWAKIPSPQSFFHVVVAAVQQRHTTLYAIVAPRLSQLLDADALHSTFAQTLLTTPVAAREPQFKTWLETALSWPALAHETQWHVSLPLKQRAIVLGNLLELALSLTLNDDHRAVLLAYVSPDVLHSAYWRLGTDAASESDDANAPASLPPGVTDQLTLWTHHTMLSQLLCPGSKHFVHVCTRVYAPLCLEAREFFLSAQMLVPPTTLSSLLFALSERRVLRGLFGALGHPSDPTTAPLWVLFAGAFVQYLHTSDDLSLQAHVDFLPAAVDAMRLRLYHVLWLPQGPVSAMTLLDLGLVIKLWNLLFVRNTRLQFCARPDAWVWPTVLHLQQFGLELSAEDGISLGEFFEAPLLGRLHFVLSTLPQAIPFATRVQFFTECIDREKAHIPGRHVFSQLRPLRIRRDAMIADSFEAFESIFVEQGAAGLKSRMQVTFVNAQGLDEAGVDGGGVFKEYMDLLTKHAFSTEHPFFLATDDRLLYPNPSAAFLFGSDPGRHYRFLGRVLAKALYEGILIEPPFAPFFLQKLLGQLNSLDDLQSLDATLYRHILEMKQTPSLIDDMGLTFSVATSRNGAMHVQELVPNGQATPVTAATYVRYIHLLANFKLNAQIAPATHAFLQGFHDILPSLWLLMFSPTELQMLIGGATRDVDVDDWKANTNYGGGYHPSQPIVQWFWDIVAELSPDDRGELLKFITSCSRQPLLGFKQLQPLICIQQVRISDDERLPSSATCMNLLKLPTYSSKDVMRAKLLYAIRSKAGFELS